jgi:FkbM family methyltransferase
MSVHLYSFGDYEQEVVDLLYLAVVRSKHKNPILVDVGANLGTMSLPLAMKLRCQTISIEPQPLLNGLLKENSAANGVGHLVRVVGKAAGSAPGKSSFSIDPTHLATAGLGGMVSGDAIEVEVERLDRIVSEEEWLRTAILKVDVEGFERDVFAGAGELLAKRQPPIVFEVNLPALAGLGMTETDVAAPLRAVGYTRFYALEKVLYPPENGVHQPANILAITEDDVELAKAYGFSEHFAPKRRKFIPFAPLHFLQVT